MGNEELPRVRQDDGPSTDMRQIRSNLADNGLVFYALASMPALVFSMARSFEHGWKPLYSFHLALVAITVTLTIFRKRLPYSVRAGWLLSLSFVVGAVGLAIIGPFGGGFGVLCLFPVLVAVAMGIRAGLVASALGVGVVVCIGAAVLTGRLQYTYDVVTYVNSPSGWTNLISAFVLWVPAAVIAFGTVHAHLGKTVVELKKSQGIRKRLFESSKVPTLVLEIENYTFVDCNDAAVDAYGFADRNALLGKTPESVSPPTQPDGKPTGEAVREFVGRALRETELLFEWRHVRPDGECWDAEVHLMRFVAGGDTFLQCAITDITSRRQAEDALRSSEKRYHSLFENANDAIFLLKEGQFVDCNPKTLEMFGCTRDQIVGASPQEYSPEFQPDGRTSEESAREKIQRALGGESLSFEWKHMRHDDTLFDADVSLNHLTLDGDDLLLAIVRDITERKLAEADLRQFALVIEQATEIVVITDTDGLITYVNPAFERVTGYSRDESIGQNPRFLKSGKTPVPEYEKLWKTLKAGKTWSGRFANKTRMGVEYTEDASISPLRDPAGAIVSYVAVKRDISHELVLENRIRQAQKMEAMGVLAGGIAHDFNNILSAMLGFTDLALMDAEGDEAITSSLQEVAVAGQRAKDLVAQILTFSRQAERERKPMRLQAVALEALKLLRGSIPSTVEIRQDINKDCPPIFGDSTETHQILMNLCTNAYHAIPESGGIIEVSIAQVSIGEEEAETLPGLVPGLHVRLAVSDNGHGMDESTRTRIFEPYFTTKGRGEGTGLGLATVHGIVKEMGGAIAVYSEPGHGTTFSIVLPVADMADTVAGAAHRDTSALAGSERILLVDDEKPIAQFAEAVLSRLGYQVTVVTNSVDALALFEEDPERFDLVITDQMMPAMRGTELSQKLQAIRPSVPIVMCSGFGDILQDAASHECGICEHVMKPIVAADLAGAIRRVMEAG